MKILMSPAKTLDFNRKIRTQEHSEAVYEYEANTLVKRMKAYDTTSLREVMSMSDKLAELTYERFQMWDNDDVEMKQAGAAFKGEAYNGLDLPSLTTDELSYAQDCLRILSGMYGILKPCDIIKPYRLEMGSKLKPSLYDMWTEKITHNINEEEKELVVNLASLEYFKAIDQAKLKARVVSCDFKEMKEGKLKTVVVYTKKARGYMARYIIQNNIDKIEELKQFNTDGYAYNEELSSENNLIFVR